MGIETGLLAKTVGKLLLADYCRMQ